MHLQLSSVHPAWSAQKAEPRLISRQPTTTLAALTTNTTSMNGRLTTIGTHADTLQHSVEEPPSFRRVTQLLQLTFVEVR